jgi:MinD-like ATPase involved in chromosome partitioning or flagellar assembly
VAKIISTHSFRGGTGKSNSTANLAVMVARAGHRVGVIDTDIQSPGIHVLFAFKQNGEGRSLNDYLWKRCAIEEAAFDITDASIGTAADSDRPRLFLIPSSLNTGEIARILREGYDVGMLNDGFRRLIEQLKLDYLFIDTHPGVNEETLLSIAISDVLILVMRPDNQDFQGTAITAELARRLNVPEILIVVNKVPDGTNESLLRAKVEDSYRAPVAAMLPLCEDVAQLASAGVFSNRFPDHPFSRKLHRVAQRLMGIEN